MKRVTSRTLHSVATRGLKVIKTMLIKALSIKVSFQTVFRTCNQEVAGWNPALGKLFTPMCLDTDSFRYYYGFVKTVYLYLYHHRHRTPCSKTPSYTASWRNVISLFIYSITRPYVYGYGCCSYVSNTFIRNISKSCDNLTIRWRMLIQKC